MEPKLAKLIAWAFSPTALILIFSALILAQDNSNGAAGYIFFVSIVLVIVTLPSVFLVELILSLAGKKDMFSYVITAGVLGFMTLTILKMFGSGYGSLTAFLVSGIIFAICGIIAILNFKFIEHLLRGEKRMF